MTSISKEAKSKPAFKNGNFNPRNWFSREFNEIRDILEKLTIYGSKNYKSRNFKIECIWYADEKYYFVYYLPEKFLYIINWYKSRGAVDSFLFQGTPIDIGAYEHLMSKLRKELC